MNQGPCIQVGKGGVGESGSSVMLTHNVVSPIEKLVKFQNSSTSLCPNTGVAAMIVINGSSITSGNLTAAGSFIQATVQSGDSIVVIAHTVPLFNGVSCVRLGEAELSLQECDLVTNALPTPQPLAPPEAMPGIGSAGQTINCNGVATRNWNAFIDEQPSESRRLIVAGVVTVPNPGVEAELEMREPPGINPRIQSLNLRLIQLPGLWPQVEVCKQARFEHVLTTEQFDAAEIFCGDQVIAQPPVHVVQ